MEYINNKRISEANIQAEVYHRLKLLEIYCELEYVIDDCRFDIIITDKLKEKILLIIECKNYEHTISINMVGNQIKKYSRFGIPIMAIVNETKIEPAIEIIKDVMQNEKSFNDFTNKFNVITLITEEDKQETRALMKIINKKLKIINKKEKKLDNTNKHNLNLLETINDDVKNLCIILFDEAGRLDMNNSFIDDLKKDFKKTSKLSPKQIKALKNIITEYKNRH